MKAVFLKFSNCDKEESQYSKIIDGHGQQTQRSQSHKIVLLSLRKPSKMARKEQIKQLFQHERKVTGSFLHQYQSFKSQPNEEKHEGQALPTFKLNLRNLISKSTPYVTAQSKAKTTIKKTMHKEFRISKDTKATHKERILAIKIGGTKSSQKSGMNESQGSEITFQNKEGFKSRKNKVTFYINNFMKTKYSKARKISLDSDYDKSRLRQDNLKSSEFFPWERSFDTEEDGLLPN